MPEPFQDSDDILFAFDAPAFVRRALHVEIAWDGLMAVCRREQERLLEMPRIRLARFVLLRKSWSNEMSCRRSAALTTLRTWKGCIRIGNRV